MEKSSDQGDKSTVSNTSSSSANTTTPILSRAIDLNKTASPDAANSSDSQLTVRKTPPTATIFGAACHSTPDSSQTESDDISPQIQRKRLTHNRDKLPRFSISFDDEINTT